ncbi:MAG TPA: sugar ABC transporter permease [Galbitalea sp.]
MTQTPPAPAAAPATPSDLQDERLVRPANLRESVAASFKRVRTGDLGSLPVVIGLVVICVIFQILNSNFLGAENISDTLVDTAGIGFISVGIVLVLLLGQIDLSVGSMSGFSAAIFGVLLTKNHWPEWVIIIVCIVVGAVVGLIYGALFVRFGVPSFVITLAGLLALLGAQLATLGPLGSINIPFTTFIVNFSLTQFLPTWLNYVLVVVAGLGYAGTALARANGRRRAGLSAPAVSGILVKAIILVVALGLIVAYVSTYAGGGIGDSFVALILLVVIMQYVLTRTRFGREVFAVGGNVEAARRAGIRVNRIYVTVFILCAVLAALGGLLNLGHLASASTSSGTGDVNLDAIAGAVIGGTSLFGGRGSAWSALLGILVITAISQGLNLLSLDSSVRFMITGGVLLLAVIVDSLSRRSRASHGQA